VTNLLDNVAMVLRETATEIILPRFNALTTEQIKEKSGPGDLVTVADIEAEEKLSNALKQLIPGSQVVGEEATSRHPDTINFLSNESLVWVVDPIDGTKNFTRGNHLFCIMVCLIKSSSPILAVIFDPLSDTYLSAEEGSGAWLHNANGISAQKLKIQDTVDLNQMSGFLSLGGFKDRPTRDKMRLSASKLFKRYDSLGCSGHEYIQIITNQRHFTINYRTLPWDHLPGSLIHSEAGGYQASFNGAKYDPTKLTKGLVSAPSEVAWKHIQESFLSKYLPDCLKI
tara:strand:+ start:1433 stop:2284 length:852 start_codon:yes stop_codon:yes gene_type:complete